MRIRQRWNHDRQVVFAFTTNERKTPIRFTYGWSRIGRRDVMSVDSEIDAEASCDGCEVPTGVSAHGPMAVDVAIDGVELQ